MKMRGGSFYFGVILIFILFINSTYNECFGVKHERLRELKLLTNKIPSSFQTDAIVILKDSQYIYLEPLQSGNIVRTYRYRCYSVKNINPPLLKKISFYYYKFIELTPEFKIRVHYPNGKVFTKDYRKIEEERLITNKLFSTDTFTKKFSLPVYKKGMFVEVEEKRIYNKPEFFYKILLSNKCPTLRKNICLSFPGDSKIQYKFLSTGSIDIIHDSLNNTSSGKTEINIKINNCRAYYPFDNHESIPSMYFSIPPLGKVSYSWKLLGQFYLDYFKKNDNSTELLSEFSNWIKGNDEKIIIKNTLEYLRNKIRYHSDTQGPWGFYPRPIDEIITKGYGDCKEMSFLLKTMLQEKGIKTYLTIISTTSNLSFNKIPPSLGLFDHMVLCYTDNSGEQYILDPTIPFGNPFHAYYVHIDKNILILRKNDSYISRVKVLNNYKNKIETHSRIIQSESDKRWKMEGNILLTGMNAFQMYSAFNNKKKHHLDKNLRTFLNKTFNLRVDTFYIQTLIDDSIKIFYRNDIEKKLINLKQEGIVIDLPSINNLFACQNNKRGQYDFPGNHPFSQKDIWELPAKFTSMEKKDLNHKLGQITWKQNKREIIRSYQQTENSTPYDTIKEYIKKRRKHSQAIIWEK